MVLVGAYRGHGGVVTTPDVLSGALARLTTEIHLHREHEIAIASAMCDFGGVVISRPVIWVIHASMDIPGSADNSWRLATYLVCARFSIGTGNVRIMCVCIINFFTGINIAIFFFSFTFFST